MNNNQNTNGEQNTFINTNVNFGVNTQNSSTQMPGPVGPQSTPPVQPTVAPTPDAPAPQAPAAPQNNVVTLGTVSNVTYADTIGDIDLGEPIKDTEEESTSYLNNTEYNPTSLTDLNVEGNYNNMNVAPDYTTDPKVMENLHPDPEKKQAITINKELKTFFVIAVILLVFIFVMPIIVDLFNKIRFR